MLLISCHSLWLVRCSPPSTSFLFDIEWVSPHHKPKEEAEREKKWKQEEVDKEYRWKSKSFIFCVWKKRFFSQGLRSGKRGEKSDFSSGAGFKVAWRMLRAEAAHEVKLLLNNYGGGRKAQKRENGTHLAHTQNVRLSPRHKINENDEEKINKQRNSRARFNDKIIKSTKKMTSEALSGSIN